MCVWHLAHKIVDDVTTKRDTKTRGELCLPVYSSHMIDAVFRIQRVPKTVWNLLGFEGWSSLTHWGWQGSECKHRDRDDRGVNHYSENRVPLTRSLPSVLQHTWSETHPSPPSGQCNLTQGELLWAISFPEGWYILRCNGLYKSPCPHQCNSTVQKSRRFWSLANSLVSERPCFLWPSEAQKLTSFHFVSAKFVFNLPDCEPNKNHLALQTANDCTGACLCCLFSKWKNFGSMLSTETYRSSLMEVNQHLLTDSLSVGETYRPPAPFTLMLLYIPLTCTVNKSVTLYKSLSLHLKKLVCTRSLMPVGQCSSTLSDWLDCVYICVWQTV